MKIPSFNDKSAFKSDKSITLDYTRELFSHKDISLKYRMNCAVGLLWRIANQSAAANINALEFELKDVFRCIHSSRNLMYPIKPSMIDRICTIANFLLIEGKGDKLTLSWINMHFLQKKEDLLKDWNDQLIDFKSSTSSYEWDDKSKSLSGIIDKNLDQVCEQWIEMRDFLTYEEFKSLADAYQNSSEIPEKS